MKSPRRKARAEVNKMAIRLLAGLLLPVLLMLLVVALLGDLDALVVAGGGGIDGRGGGLGKKPRGGQGEKDEAVAESMFHEIKGGLREKTSGTVRSYGEVCTEVKNFCKRTSTFAFPKTRNMLVMLGPALVPDTASRATAW